MLLNMNDGTVLDLEGQFGTAKRKLAEAAGTNAEDIAELKTADGKRIVIAPANASWAFLIQE